MSIGWLAPAPSSAEIQVVDSERYDEVERKQKLVSRLLVEHGLDGLLLLQPANFSWFTCGAVVPQVSPTEPTAALFITRDSRVVVTNNIDSGELFDKQVPGLGFLLKERPWHEPRQVLMTDILRGRTAGCDTHFPDTRCLADEVAALRLQLSPFETARMRRLGHLVSHALEATARHIAPGETELDIVGQIGHRLLKHDVEPLQVRVAADGRLRRYRHYRGEAVPMRSWCVMTASGHSQGLCCSASRVVCFGNPPQELTEIYQHTAMLLATAVYFSQAGFTLGDVWDRVQRIYDKTGHVEEWQLADQGAVLGYQAIEHMIVPSSTLTLVPGMALHWQPAVGSVRVGDTMLVGPGAGQIITSAEPWPLLHIAVKGIPCPVPDVLCREAP